MSEANDIRPVVATGGNSNLGLWGFAAVLLIGGAMLYNAISAADQSADAPSVLVPSDGSQGRISSPAPLRTPERFLELEPLAQSEPEPTPTLREPLLPPAPLFQLPPAPRPITPPLPLFQEPETSPETSTGPEVVFEASAPTAPTTSTERSESGVDRVAASRLLNPSRTIPQGTVIPAVLETALDSTRPGGVRALVQRDVSSFDGSRVLIPRGSRLYGQYEASLQPGQNRALVQWTRLIRPDGVTIALNSPSSDPLGRAGIRGRVDSKFLQRFGGALLQSVLDIGVGLAASEATDGVIVALPGSTQNVQVSDQQRR